VILLYGSVPDWRPLAAGVTGQDVSQLNHDLVALGDADRAGISALGWDYFSWATAAGVAKLQAALGASVPSGWLPLGSVVFAPRALRVRQVTGSLGGPADGPVLAATSDQHVVTVPLDVSRQGEVRAGDRVTVTLPGGTTTPGTVSSVGTVATTSGSGGNPVTTIPVLVILADPRAAGNPGPGAGDGEHHHRHRPRRAGGAGDGSGGPGGGAVCGGGHRPGELAALGAGDPGDLR
jgi:hypothetical protein